LFPKKKDSVVVVIGFGTDELTQSLKLGFLSPERAQKQCFQLHTNKNCVTKTFFCTFLENKRKCFAFPQENFYNCSTAK
jgi:hypothetical protein